MEKTIVATGKTIDLAIESALTQLDQCGLDGILNGLAGGDDTLFHVVSTSKYQRL